MTAQINLNLATIHFTASIKEALEKINQNGLQICFILNQENKLVGSITDGDVRRYLLKNGSIQDIVTSAMSKNTITTSSALPRRQALEFMINKSILVLPLVNGNNQILDLYTVKALSTPQIKQNPVFIMAGGFGTRLRPLTDSTPKPMLPVGNRPILEIIISHLKSFGFINFYISTHYLPEVIQNYFGDGERFGVHITYVHEHEPLGTGGALGLLPKDISDLPLIMMNGDILTNLDFEMALEAHANKQAVATMCVHEFDYQIPYGVVESNNQQITQLVEKPKYTFHINTGIYILNHSIIKSINTGAVISMPDILQAEINKKHNVSIFPLHAYWLDIGQMTDYNKAQQDILTLGI